MDFCGALNVHMGGFQLKTFPPGCAPYEGFLKGHPCCAPVRGEESRHGLVTLLLPKWFTCERGGVKAQSGCTTVAKESAAQLIASQLDHLLKRMILLVYL